MLTKQLEKFAEVAVGRELKMAKMEKEIESLKAKLTPLEVPNKEEAMAWLKEE
jgi:hypothetical protein